MVRNCTNSGGDNSQLSAPCAGSAALPGLATSGWTHLVLSSLDHQTNMMEARRAPLGATPPLISKNQSNIHPVRQAATLHSHLQAMPPFGSVCPAQKLQTSRGGVALVRNLCTANSREKMAAAALGGRRLPRLGCLTRHHPLQSLFPGRNQRSNVLPVAAKDLCGRRSPQVYTVSQPVPAAPPPP